MRRRQFIALLGAAAAAWPRGVRAQQLVRRVTVLVPRADDPALDPAFEQGLAQRGWIVGRNVQIDYRWAINSADKTKAAVAELLVRPPDVIVAFDSRTVAALQKAMPTVPIVFATITEPVAQGFVQSLAHPGGNATGFTNVPATIGGKWLELLAEMAPGVTHVAYMYNPSNPGPLEPYASVKAAAHKHAVTVALAAVHSAAEIETAMTTLGREPGGGLIVSPDGFLSSQHQQIIELAAREKLPAIYAFAFFAAQGGLASYGVSLSEQVRQAGVYVGRILRGDKPADLPVQRPSQYELVINLKAAKALGLHIPPTMLASADKVIE
jgi:putative tryptophan/tyrosine transport system substrate-binding protein